jgi:hypothetical protein
MPQHWQIATSEGNTPEIGSPKHPHLVYAKCSKTRNFAGLGTRTLAGRVSDEKEKKAVVEIYHCLSFFVSFFRFKEALSATPLYRGALGAALGGVTDSLIVIEPVLGFGRFFDQ